MKWDDEVNILYGLYRAQRGYKDGSPCSFRIVIFWVVTVLWFKL